MVKGGGIVAGIRGHRVAVGNAALMRAENVIFTGKMTEDIAAMDKFFNTRDVPNNTINQPVRGDEGEAVPA